MGIQIFEQIPNESVREYVYRVIRSNIITLHLEPGSSLSEKEVAELLNISRTPVREAFIKLAQEALLDVLPQKGTNVSLIDLNHVAETKFLRETVEREVVKKACLSFPKDEMFKLQSYLSLQELCMQEQNYTKLFELDDSLHEAIYTGCGNRRIWLLLQQASTHYNRVRMLNLAFGYNWPRIVEEHKNIVSAIQRRDPELGQQMVNAHLNKVAIDIEVMLKKYNHYFKPNSKITQSSDI